MEAATVEHCNIAETWCVNPAGYQVGGTGGPMGDSGLPQRTRVECRECGNKACANCRVKRNGKWLCLYCAGRDNFGEFIEAFARKMEETHDEYGRKIKNGIQKTRIRR